MPFWELSQRLEALTLDLWGIYSIDKADLEEQVESAIDWVQVPASTPFVDRQARNEFHLALASRTVVAAARAGRLRYLSCDMQVQQPFAIRALVPYWVYVEKWGCDCVFARNWSGAATALRPFLSHASVWLHATSTSAPREQRLLSHQDVKALQSYFGVEKMPRICLNQGQHMAQPVARYLPWLAEDEELAQQVSDAWNTVVERGEADLVKCPCERCPGSLRGRQSEWS